MTINCFHIAESIGSPGYYYIEPDHYKFHLISTKGSFNVIYARLFNISYANYLRLCRDELGATIIGKNSYYPIALFDSKEKAKKLADLLNARATLVLCQRADEQENLTLK